MTLHKTLRSLIASAVGVTIKLPAAYDIAGSYESVPDWSKVYPKPKIVFHKATEGNFYKDPKLYSDFAGMKANGIKRGAYHFHRKANATTQVQSIAQAQYFWNFIKDTIETGDKLVLDMEEGGETPKQIIDWLDEVERVSQNEIIIYSRKLLLDALVAQCTAAQLTRLKKYRLWIAGYPFYPDLYSSIPAGYVPANLGKVIAWQYSENGTVSGITGEVDLDWLDPAFAAELGAVTTPVEHTNPVPWIDEYTETVNGVKVHISLINPTGKMFHIRHFPGGLGYVSQVAKETGAVIAFNGIDYNEDLPTIIPYAPAYTAGVAANGGNPEFRYFLNISKTNIPTFTYKNFTDFYNTTSFVRPLVIDGQIAPDIRDNPNKLEYTEIHACAAFGTIADGRFIQVAAEGKVDPLTGKAYQGITVKQLVNILLKYQTVNAGQHGGGGDVQKWIINQLVNAPSDPQERAVAQVIYITTGVNTMPVIPTTKKGTANQDGIKVKETTTGVVQATLSKGQVVYGNLSTAGTDLIDVTHIYNADGVTLWSNLNTSCKVSIGTWLTVVDGKDPAETPVTPPTTDSITVDLTAYDVKMTGDKYEAKGVKMNRTA